MKRFHVHVSVGDLGESIRFYSALFGAQPSISKPDYAKWMLDDPRINFAISTRRPSIGVNHLGLQVESDQELHQMQTQLLAADADMIREDEQACCYARSDKYWVTDPAGIAWETFHTLGDIPVYGEDTPGTPARAGSAEAAAVSAACCIPVAKSGAEAIRSQCCAK